MEIGTIKTAIEKEHKKEELSLMTEEQTLNVQGSHSHSWTSFVCQPKSNETRSRMFIPVGHVEVLNAKRQQFKSAFKSNKIESKIFDDLNELLFQLEIYLATISLSKTLESIRQQMQTLLPTNKVASRGPRRGTFSFLF